jgi:hypothetical protein
MKDTYHKSHCVPVIDDIDRIGKLAPFDGVYPERSRTGSG